MFWKTCNPFYTKKLLLLLTLGEVALLSCLWIALRHIFETAACFYNCLEGDCLFLGVPPWSYMAYILVILSQIYSLNLLTVYTYSLFMYMIKGKTKFHLDLKTWTILAILGWISFACTEWFFFFFLYCWLPFSENVVHIVFVCVCLLSSAGFSPWPCKKDLEVSYIFLCFRKVYRASKLYLLQKFKRTSSMNSSKPSTDGACICRRRCFDIINFF